MKTLTIHLTKNYSIHFDNNLLETTLLKDYCIALNKKIVIITDSNLIHTLGNQLKNRLENQGISTELLYFPAGEIYKTRETKQQLEDELLQKHYGRDTGLIALGGGVVSDLVGFIAATYCRGLPVIYIPTTLLAMVDASIGGKTGVNTPYGKNLIGSFTQPHAVLIDHSVLNTLPQKEWHNGIVEMIKHSVIADKKLFNQLTNHSEKIKQKDQTILSEIIYTNCLIKKTIVEQDENEKSLRHILNFGHTIGHAIELIENYQISHGEAVAIGMLVESYLSVQCGYLAHEDFILIEALLRQYDLPLATSAFNHKAHFQQTLILDKKSINQTAQFVLLEQIGKPYCHKNKYIQYVSPGQLNAALDWAAQFFQPMSNAC